MGVVDTEADSPTQRRRRAGGRQPPHRSLPALAFWLAELSSHYKSENAFPASLATGKSACYQILLRKFTGKVLAIIFT